MSKAKIKTHYWADEYPLNQDDIDALARSIAADGQKRPILALKDGTIIDGRNRWFACEAAGVKPVIEVVNPNGEELTDEEIFKISTRENSLRRDVINSCRAVQAARAWKRLYPEGAPNAGQFGKRGKSETRLAATTFEDFALEQFKGKKDSAKKALAIVNFGQEKLVDEARIGLESAYTKYQGLKAEERERQLKIDALMSRDDCADLRERMDKGGLSVDEALAIMMDRTKKERERKEAMERAQKQVRDTVMGFTKFKVGDEALEAFYANADENRQCLKALNDELPAFIDGVSKIHAAIKEALKTKK